MLKKNKVVVEFWKGEDGTVTGHIKVNRRVWHQWGGYPIEKLKGWLGKTVEREVENILKIVEEKY